MSVTVFSSDKTNDLTKVFIIRHNKSQYIQFKFSFLLSDFWQVKWKGSRGESRSFELQQHWRSRPDFRNAASYLDVLDELLCWRVDGRFGVDDVLNGVGPTRGLIQQLTVQAVRVFTAVHDHIPVACQEEETKTISLVKPHGKGTIVSDWENGLEGKKKSIMLGHTYSISCLKKDFRYSEPWFNVKYVKLQM